MEPFVDVDPGSHFTIHNLPFGVFEHPATGESRCATAIGNYLVDLYELENQRFFDSTILKGKRAFSFTSLDLFLSLGSNVWKSAADRLREILTGKDPSLKNNPRLREQAFHLREDVKMLLPVRSENLVHSLNSQHFLEKQVHNSGWMKQYKPLLQQMPVLRSGHTSSLMVSGSKLTRPSGPRILEGEKNLTISPSRALDAELCLAFISGKAHMRDMTMTVRKAEESIFGYMLALNVIARDFVTGDTTFKGQKIATVLSPWIVPASSLEPFRNKSQNLNRMMRHLQSGKEGHFDLTLDLILKSRSDPDPFKLSSTNTKYLNWSPAREFAHFSVTGHPAEIGDLFVSGPVSGPGQAGASLMELSDSGNHVIVLPGGEERNSLQDGDTLIASGYGEHDGHRIGFGKVAFTVGSIF
jgi:fumarylacetoacetase